MVKPINNIVKGHFDSLLELAKDKAENDFVSRIESKLPGLDHFNQLKLLVEEDERNDVLIDKSEFPFYIEDSTSGDWLLNQFSSRAFLLNVDESEQFVEGVSLGLYRKLIFQKIEKLREGVPPYSYDQFIREIVSPYFANLKSNWSITENDFYQIRKWQAENLIKIISYESLMLIKKLQLHCKSLANPLEFIQAENEKIESRLENVKPDAKEIKSVLSELFIFGEQSPDKFNDELLVENYNLYKSNAINWKFIFPKYLNPLLEKVKKESTSIISNESTIFFTINKIAWWLEAVIKGQSIQQPVIEEDWEQNFDNLISEANKKADILKNELENFVEKSNLSKKEIGEYLIEQFDNYRYKFNAFEKQYLFATLKEEHRDLLKRSFTVNSFFGNDVAEQTKSITEAIIIHEMLWKTMQEYCYVFDTHKMDVPGKDAGYLEVMSLMNQMVLDKELYAPLRKSMDDFGVQFENYFLPFELHIQNQREVMADLFHKSLQRLEEHLGEADQNNKILYLQTRLKDLRQREIQLKRFEHMKEFDEDEFRYSNLFKEFLQIEADFIRETKDITLLPSLPQSKPPLAIGESPQTFDNLLPEKNAAFILQMLEGLSITVNGKAQLSVRKKGALRGVVEAARAKGILPQKSIDFLCSLIADKIGLELKSKLDSSTTSDSFQKKADRYIAEHYLA